MNILIVDNKSKHIYKLVGLLSSHDVKVVRYRKHTHLDREWADLIVLSGGNKPFLYRKYFQQETSFIQQTDVPIIGICLGFELIANAFGERLSRRRKKVYGIHAMELCSDYFGFEKDYNYDVFEAHRWALTDPEYLGVHAQSINGAEIIKHPTKKIIGFQFHTEVQNPHNEGSKFLLASIEILSKDSNLQVKIG